jgi:hypothetical protein
MGKSESFEESVLQDSTGGGLTVPPGKGSGITVCVV